MSAGPPVGSTARSAAGHSRARTRAQATASRSRRISGPGRRSIARSPPSRRPTRTRPSVTTPRWRKPRATAASPPSAASEPRDSRAARPLLPVVGVAAALRAPVAARRRGGRDRGHGPGGAEEPRVRGHRGRAAAERALRGRRRRNHLRALLHVPAHLDGAELVARGRRRRRGARHRRRRRRRRRSWSRRSRSRPGSCSCCSRCSGWGGSPASCRRRWSRASWPEPPSTWSSGSCRSSPAPRPRVTARGASSRRGWGRSARSTGRRCSSAAPRSP